MKFRLSDFQASLRTRFALGLGAVLLPFLVAAAVGQFYLLPRLIGPFEELAEEVVEELEPIKHLQVALLQAAMPPNDWLIHGDPAERQQFSQLSRKVDQVFEKARAAPFAQAEERALVESAQKEWREAQRMGAAILRLCHPAGNREGARDMERLDGHVDRAVALLDQLHDIAHEEIKKELATAHAARPQAIFLTLGTFVLAAAASLFAGVALARSVTDPVDALRQGAARLAEGKLSHRVAIHRNDELSELAAAFNAMAGRIEADQAALVELATRDGLTGLHNHRTFYVLLGDEIARAQRFKRPVSLLLLDIDHFKRVNDMHGHQAGDAVLKGLGELLDREVRTIDRVCRYGGEEITVILPGTGLEAAANMAERLRAAVEAQPFDANSEPIRITVSIGVASFPAHADGAAALVAATDTALYAAKQRGRNRVVRYGPVAS